MHWLIWIAGAAALVFVAASAAVRLAPSDPAVWHADPVAAERRAEGAWLVRPEGGDEAAPVWDVPPGEALAAFDAVARAQPRVRVLAGSVEDGHVTYVQRSLIWGFPDYISVRALPVGDGSTLAVWSRLRFGRSDMGVNRTRVEEWLGALDLPRADA